MRLNLRPVTQVLPGERAYQRGQYKRNQQRPDQPHSGSTNSVDANDFDRDAFRTLARDYGGLAGWYCKQQKNGKWDRDTVDEYLMRLYEGRRALESADDSERVPVVLSLFAGDPEEAELDRIQTKWEDRDNS
jgi:hypothetical protein